MRWKNDIAEAWIIDGNLVVRTKYPKSMDEDGFDYYFKIETLLSDYPTIAMTRPATVIGEIQGKTGNT